MRRRYLEGEGQEAAALATGEAEGTLGEVEEMKVHRCTTSTPTEVSSPQEVQEGAEEAASWACWSLPPPPPPLRGNKAARSQRRFVRRPPR